MESPSIGRIVHYVSRGSADGLYPPRHVPFLIVEELPSGVVCGWTFNPHGTRYEMDVPYSEEPQGGTWHWPERVP